MEDQVSGNCVISATSELGDIINKLDAIAKTTYTYSSEVLLQRLAIEGERLSRISSQIQDLKEIAKGQDYNPILKLSSNGNLKLSIPQYSIIGWNSSYISYNLKDVVKNLQNSYTVLVQLGQLLQDKDQMLK